jgi:DNA-binding transcriptional ArsR family regulator
MSAPPTAPASSHDGLNGSDEGSEASSFTDASDVAFEELLDLLGDDYACAILQALAGGAMPARTLAERCDMSRPTVYRRLDRLTAAGVVDARLRPAADGHHRQEFRLVLDEVQFRVGEDGIDGSVRVREDGD